MIYVGCTIGRTEPLLCGFNAGGGWLGNGFCGIVVVSRPSSRQSDNEQYL